MEVPFPPPTMQLATGRQDTASSGGSELAPDTAGVVQSSAPSVVSMMTPVPFVRSPTAMQTSASGQVTAFRTSIPLGRPVRLRQGGELAVEDCGAAAASESLCCGELVEGGGPVVEPDGPLVPLAPLGTPGEAAPVGPTATVDVVGGGRASVVDVAPASVVGGANVVDGVVVVDSPDIAAAPVAPVRAGAFVPCSGTAPAEEVPAPASETASSETDPSAMTRRARW
ncbi:MAG TPA: hypothetical protein VMD59_03060 [Acidimicrobiales bacterium]|nr:hypothetical protein [Acidimicrobiales bacterium]